MTSRCLPQPLSCLARAHRASNPDFCGSEDTMGLDAATPDLGLTTSARAALSFKQPLWSHKFLEASNLDSVCHGSRWLRALRSPRLRR